MSRQTHRRDRCLPDARQVLQATGWPVVELHPGTILQQAIYKEFGFGIALSGGRVGGDLGGQHVVLLATVPARDSLRVV